MKTRYEVLGFIADYTAEHGWPPSYEEVAGGLGLASKGSVAFHVRNLRNDGLIRQESRKARKLAVTDEGMRRIREMRGTL